MGQLRLASELRASLVEAAELGEDVAAHTQQEVAALKRWLRGQGIDELEVGSISPFESKSMDAF